MKTALVTGASSGIGRALALELSSRGVRVVATARRASALAELAEGRPIEPIPCDLGTAEGPAELWAETMALLKKAPDFLVNCAGYNSRKANIVDVTPEEMDAQYFVNLRSPMLLSKLALAEMSLRGDGHILNVGSTVVHLGCEKMGVYSAMKTGLLGFTRVLIKEARPLGVKVTLAHPGGTDSGFRVEARPDYMASSSVAKVLADCLFAPQDVVVHEITFRPLVETNF